MTGGGNANGASPSSVHQAYPLSALLRTRLRQPQFYWFLGHFLALYHFVCLHLSFWSWNNQLYHYEMCLLYVSVTYTVVLYQFYKSGQLRFVSLRQFFRILKTLDNLQYFVLVAFFLILAITQMVMISGVLYPLMVFSVFHFLNYFKENLLPFLPINSIFKNLVNNNFTNFINNYSNFFFQMAQFFEIITCLKLTLIKLPLLLVKFPVLMVTKNDLYTILASIFYLYFFKLRYLQSKSMQLLLTQLVMKADSNIPLNYKSIWLKYKNLIKVIFENLPVA
ncbi:hypothetical protein TPHA_0D00280 [Tetrapisispora phaffii CBS 4417]|uniref:Pore and endoplasmic reticulum protein of 33 kDa n=1 Tax=Tetrapisispora phaffii (strain ATCC 24235 / CBS 4417 / NBRC 1672 / NRRL Y-8282 / UCD 70-5) TaxID=1071381 RepID=G8BS51_TETPH|nr:hypothetical protein TPHA_0D00280 [Tetrapisispora phaffii CBS 4417]CCE62672.1 hypothetical protein TPHA_0D00280 [Tetrapisispora phaffii CBS 4417]